MNVQKLQKCIVTNGKTINNMQKCIQILQQQFIFKIKYRIIQIMQLKCIIMSIYTTSMRCFGLYTVGIFSNKLPKCQWIYMRNGIAFYFVISLKASDDW